MLATTPVLNIEAIQLPAANYSTFFGGYSRVNLHAR